jgi:regulator of replication initiation timing
MGHLNYKLILIKQSTMDMLSVEQQNINDLFQETNAINAQIHEQITALKTRVDNLTFENARLQEKLKTTQDPEQKKKIDKLYKETKALLESITLQLQQVHTGEEPTVGVDQGDSLLLMLESIKDTVESILQENEAIKCKFDVYSVLYDTQIKHFNVEFARVLREKVLSSDFLKGIEEEDRNRGKIKTFLLKKYKIFALPADFDTKSDKEKYEFWADNQIKDINAIYGILTETIISNESTDEE